MTLSGDSHGDMERFAIDIETGDRLLSGVLDPEDAPDRLSAVAALLQAAAVPTSGALDGEAATVDAVVAVIRSAPAFVPPPTKTSRLTRAKIAAAGLAGALSMTTGLAAANALPGAAQQVASDALSKVGVHVPSPDDEAGEHPAVRGKSDDHNDSTGTSVPASDAAHPDNQGGEISDLAHTTDPGPGHGATVSDAASDGKSQAGEPHGNPASPEPQGGPPVSTPAANQGNNGAGHQSEGTSLADEHRNGAGSPDQSNAGGRKP